MTFLNYKQVGSLGLINCT